MIDLRNLREHTEVVSSQLRNRGVPKVTVDELLATDVQLREAIAARDEARARVNDLSREVGRLSKQGEVGAAAEVRERSRQLGASLKGMEAAVAQLAERRDAIWLVLPNIPAHDAPIGEDESANRVVRYWSPGGGHQDPGDFTLPAFTSYQRVPHWEIGANLAILDLERAGKISGSMFAMYRGQGARLLRALTNFALAAHADAYEEIRPPTLVRRETMMATGHLPKFADEAYAVERDGLYAIPTAEVPLTSLGRDEIFAEADLPLRFTAYTSCFRREAGAAGRDTRGLLRLHEFDKVELLVYCVPSDATAMHFDILSRAERLIQRLGLIYRVLDLCTGDLGQSSARTFDLEVYSPGTGKWLEVSSVSWFSDYQARRANIRYRPSSGGGPEFVNTLNGSALAWPRIFATLLEVGHQEDGTVHLPPDLATYFGAATLESQKIRA